MWCQNPFILFFFLCSWSLFPQLQDTTLFHKYYKLSENEKVFVPFGKIAFADSIIDFNQGKPASKPPFNNPKNSLGEPDFKRYSTPYDPKYVSVGCGGSLTVKFVDNGFIDVPGDDLVFFEIGPSIEPFNLEISSDGKEWLELGEIEGGPSTIDISKALPVSKRQQIFHYIRITDLEYFCNGPTPGSDIDAIGAIGAVIKLSLDAKILSDTDKFVLRKNAKRSLKKLNRQLKEIPKAELLINGHTDSDGSFEHNILLAENRAKSVQKYLQKNINDVGEYTYSTKSFGETKPISSNKTSEGKQQNRRVEIIVKPHLAFYKIPEN